ncbi:hypothetical protein N7474_000180 [Penicillium riverlandense]|uniref:uncharacterized protein n=1 Tax=Penicillium riverlandense TaxID=1903569 RepID=UPI0025467A8B|nr:uncharacterized protein N7474_000180 [Penicillium riverlandense]KAJ5831869.1 hypothetical protein N7474_000180 [Penicillium riverlandense]
MDFLPARQDIIMPGKPALPALVYRTSTPEKLIDHTIENHTGKLSKSSVVGGDDSFFVADLGQVSRQHHRWTHNLPGVRPFYAVKCNSDPILLQHLADLGTSFDCASIEEMRAVLDLGIDPVRILFAHPCKSPAALVFARQVGVCRTVFDNLDELDSIKTHMPRAQLLLRIYANDDSALICLGEKFGAPLDATQALLSRAWELGLDVVGVSFHVGTGSSNPASFCKAITHARIVFSQAQQLGFRPSILDIGGGFQDCHFEETAARLRESVRTEFPSGITTIAEPGRFYARSAYTLVCRVISRRRQIGNAAATGVPDMLYQNDGVYGNFMNVIMEKEVMVPYLVREGKHKQSTLPTKISSEKEDVQAWMKTRREHRYSIWGPTCDSVDCVVREAVLDGEVLVGDWLMYKNMGAYTSTTATQFNGFSSTHDTLYVNGEAISEY